ncbi:MAG: homocysteine S-methyltransferase family protein [Bacteroidales bacterium]|nr:homocysteine S-methyltransferase family protein [Bacteroidales bacterium]MBN2817682.1 homocysteine S-methyltransferase family protein [Bacteroidales bacterium]
MFHTNSYFDNYMKQTHPNIMKIADKIRKGQILVSDGAWGTFLQAKGLQPGECPEEWNVTHAADVYEIAKSYIDAGSDMVETNSFGGSSFKLKSYGLDGKVTELNKAAAEISRKAAGPDKHVLGSIGPTGKILMMGEVTADDLYEAFKQQAVALEAGGADAIVIETMSDMEEAVAAVKAVKENTGCEVICTMTFEKSGEDEFHTMMGVTPEQMVAELSDLGVDILGANCGNGIQNMIGISRQIRKANPEIPILIHANAGAPVYHEGKTIFPESPEEMAEFVNILVDAGANIIGGCCGTTPEHIRKIVETIKNRS